MDSRVDFNPFKAEGWEVKQILDFTSSWVSINLQTKILLPVLPVSDPINSMDKLSGRLPQWKTTFVKGIHYTYSISKQSLKMG